MDFSGVLIAKTFYISSPKVQRIYPAALGILRKIKKDVVLGDYHVQEGTMVMLSSYTIHRHPKYWERPDDLWPERFFPENSKFVFFFFSFCFIFILTLFPFSTEEDILLLLLHFLLGQGRALENNSL